MRVTFIAAPLTARSGVYRSGRELVEAGRSAGYDWKLVLGVSSQAEGTAEAEQNWVSEIVVEPTGLGGIFALRTTLSQHPFVADSDLLVSLIPQTDMALALSGRQWIAFLRGLPWPERGETSSAKRVIWRALEQVALRRPIEVWATTAILRDEVGLRRSIQLVPAGIAPVQRSWDGRGNRTRVVWAARYNQDKNPQLFFQAVDGLPLQGIMFGSGQLERELRASAPGNVNVAGWTSPSNLWDGALAYLGTSHREAFGRSALEAAMNGIPVVLSEAFGVAPFLVTDPELHRRFVLPTNDITLWRHALRALHEDESLRMAYSEHLVRNAASLTIAASAEAVASRIRGLETRL